MSDSDESLAEHAVESPRSSGSECASQQSSTSQDSRTSAAEMASASSDSSLGDSPDSLGGTPDSSVADFFEEEAQQHLGVRADRRISSPFLTKYEYALILGTRARQISQNSPVYVALPWSELKRMSPLEIAERELEERRIPLTVRRRLPNLFYEDWKLSEFLQRPPRLSCSADAAASFAVPTQGLLPKGSHPRPQAPEELTPPVKREAS